MFHNWQQYDYTACCVTYISLTIPATNIHDATYTCMYMSHHMHPITYIPSHLSHIHRITSHRIMTYIASAGRPQPRTRTRTATATRARPEPRRTPRSARCRTRAPRAGRRPPWRAAWSTAAGPAQRCAPAEGTLRASSGTRLMMMMMMMMMMMYVFVYSYLPPVYLYSHASKHI